MTTSVLGKGGVGKQTIQLSQHFEQEWSKVESSFHTKAQIIEEHLAKPNGQQRLLQHMNAYTIIYNLCINSDQQKIPVADVLYKRCKDMFEKYLSKSVTCKVKDRKGLDLLGATFEGWQNHQLLVKTSTIEFRYLDAYYTKQNPVDPLRKMMMSCFKSAAYEKVKGDLMHVLLTEIDKEREGGDINPQMLKDCINLYVEMGMGELNVYATDFEAPLITRTAEYYSRKAQGWISDLGIQAFLLNCEKAIAEEQRRSISYMHASTQPKLLSTVEQQLLTKYRDTVLDDPESGTVRMLESWRTNDLRRMYRLYKRIEGGLEPMAEKLKDFVKKEGHSINTKLCSGSIDQKSYIEQCIDLHEKFGGLIRDCMENHQIFLKARKDAFEVFINESLPLKQDEGRSGEAQKITSSELLSTYCDNLMKNEKIEPDHFEEKINMIISIFTYIQDKDLFQEFYRKQMSRRLLVSKTDSESERQLIGKLKMKMGAPYTSKLEGMITDKGMCEDQHKVFLEWVKKQGKTLAMDFSAQVLTTGFWPAFKNDQLVLPAELDEYLKLYGNYYSQKASSRVLKWINNLGTATVSAKFKNNKEYLLTVSTYQVCVLLLFNKHSEITIHQFQQELMLAVEDVKRTIQSFITPKYPILAKCGVKSGNKMSEDDAFTVNEAFANPQRKIKIPTIAAKTGGEPIEKTDESRRHVIDACIVRIMKSRKIMAHNDLQAECIKQLSATFKPDPRMIKKRIEDLIGRQYLERDSEDRNKYHYLA